MRHFRLSILAIASCLIFISCKKESEQFTTAQIADYNPNIVGKYIIYKLDSTVFTNLGTVKIVRSYQVKYVNDAMITDNLNRPAMRVIRYIRQNPTQQWSPDASFMAINTQNNFEFIENNLRFIKLTIPVSEGKSWKGNTFIDTYSLGSDLRYMDDWNYTYSNVDMPQTINGIAIENTITVEQRDEIIGDPSNPNSYSESNIAKEIYAKGIGMVYKKFYHDTYQPNSHSYEPNSYGIELTMIDHN